MNVNTSSLRVFLKNKKETNNKIKTQFVNKNNLIINHRHRYKISILMF